MNIPAPLSLVASGLIAAIMAVGADRFLTSDARAQEPPAVIQAQRFELVDTTGTVRAVIRMTPEGTGPEVALLDEAGKRRATMTQNSEGEYGFGIFDDSGTLRFGVGTTKRGFAGLNVRDGSGVIRANLYADDDGEDSGFRAWDAAGQVRAKLGYLGGEPAAFGVRVLDSQGQPVWRAP